MMDAFLNFCQIAGTLGDMGLNWPCPPFSQLACFLCAAATMCEHTRGMVCNVRSLIDNMHLL